MQGVSRLVQCIFSKAQPKRFGSNGFITGPVLAGLVEAYVEAINNGAVPTIATAWQVRVYVYATGAMQCGIMRTTSCWTDRACVRLCVLARSTGCG